MKMLVKATSKHSYVTPQGNVLGFKRPAVAQDSGFLRELIASKKVEMIAHLVEAATQVEFDAYYGASKCHSEPDKLPLAIDSFLSSFGEAQVKAAAAAKAAEEAALEDSDDTDEAMAKQQAQAAADAEKAAADKAEADKAAAAEAKAAAKAAKNAK
jgi:hypothetical protein